ncbi:ABC transporter ATP-binding protein [Lutibaculum baratangense]|uniref:Branched-chain amino acid transport ATP-binding protein LivF n=1 Tax=Lutibaculum baratangense AMV1 TaxID=631454 RepID=V4QUP0_9HYPH|nr:ATP-binding cassette domain-containing protein [Lutibaculum baratangense]ESR23447.1 Branched-chain amino acid transport ATP-binding protein LivF [Lutibaculum baratangense AMV1]
MLVLHNARVEFGGHTVLRDVSFELPQGRTTVMIGRNGAGKTTTLRTIMGLLPLSAGRITIDGQDLAEVPDHGRAALGIGYAPEDRRMIPGFTVEENLLLPTLALKLDQSTTRERLGSVYELMPELRELSRRPGGSLSGGQGKMVALGRALMVATRVILLDEPFQGLAPALALNYARTLAKVRDQRKDLTLLVTESSPQLLGGVTDRALQIERGEVMETTLAEARH